MGSNYVGLILSNGTSFGSYETAYSGVFSGPYGTMLGDVTGDGMADLVTLGSSSVSVLPATGGAGSAAFGSIQSWWPGFFYGGYGNMLGDIDGDGKADLVGLGSNYIGVLRSKGNSFGSYETGRASGFYGDHGTFLGDVNGDGKADLVALVDGAVVVALATGASPGNALFGANQTWYYASFYGSSSSRLGDVDGDGRADLIAFDTTGTVRVSRSTGSGFGAPEVWWGNTFVGQFGTLVGDIDGNGKSDLVASSTGAIAAVRSQ